MEIAQLSKSTYNYQLQSVYLLSEKYVSNMAGEDTLTQPG